MRNQTTDMKKISAARPGCLFGQVHVIPPVGRRLGLANTALPPM